MTNPRVIASRIEISLRVYEDAFRNAGCVVVREYTTLQVKRTGTKTFLFTIIALVGPDGKFTGTLRVVVTCGTKRIWRDDPKKSTVNDHVLELINHLSDKV